jgi:hypothetical protein
MTGTHDVRPDVPVGGPNEGKGGHSWMMIACCIPMLIIAIALVVTNVVNIGFLFLAVMCTAMMFMMMRGMSGGGGRT